MLTPICKNAIFSKTKQFRAMVSWRPLGSRTWVFQRTHYWTPKIQDGRDPFVGGEVSTQRKLGSKQARHMIHYAISVILQCGLVSLSGWGLACRDQRRCMRSGDPPSWILMPKCKKKPSSLELWCLLTTYRKLYMGFSKNPLFDP